MRLLTPIVADPRAPLARANPVAKLAAALVVMIALFASLDGVTSLVMLIGLVALLPFSGLSARTLISRAWLIGLAAISIGVVNVLFASEQAGPSVVDLGPMRIGGETLLDGLGLAARLVAIATAGILATATSQPTDVADALVQQLRVSPRFAVGALAALRLLPLLARDWQLARLARRARGVEARSPIGAARLFTGLLMALLVGAVRRSTRMALEMESRGFDAADCRSVARIQRMRTSDWTLLAGALLLGVAAVAVSVALGTWRPLLG